MPSKPGYTCFECSRPFHSENRYIKHMKDAHGQEVTPAPKVTGGRDGHDCPRCGIVFRTALDMTNHLLDVHHGVGNKTNGAGNGPGKQPIKSDKLHVPNASAGVQQEVVRYNDAVDEQDVVLQGLDQGLDKLAVMATMIGNEVKEQGSMLDDLGNDLEKTDKQLDKTIDREKRLIKKGPATCVIS